MGYLSNFLVLLLLAWGSIIHLARHTWATLAKRLNVSIAVISEALGHRDVKTTSIYLGAFDRAAMDKLSEKMSAAAKTA